MNTPTPNSNNAQQQQATNRPTTGKPAEDMNKKVMPQQQTPRPQSTDKKPEEEPETR